MTSRRSLFGRAIQVRPQILACDARRRFDRDHLIGRDDAPLRNGGTRDPEGARRLCHQAALGAKEGNAVHARC